MKKLVFSFVCSIMVIHSFCQTSTTPLTKEDYLKKRKTQNTLAWVLMAGGASLLIIGGTMGMNFDGLFDPNAPQRPPPKNNESLAAILQITGGAAMLVSIPFFVAASKNKKKAMSVALIIEKVPAICYGSNRIYQSYPAIGLHLKLGKSN